MSHKRLSDQTSQESAVALKAPPLGSADLALLQDLIDEIAPAWTVELHGIRAEEASLILLPHGGDDLIGPSFLVTRESDGFRLDQVRWDEMTETGFYPSLIDVLAAIRCRLAVGPGHVDPGMLTIH